VWTGEGADPQNNRERSTDMTTKMLGRKKRALLEREKKLREGGGRKNAIKKAKHLPQGVSRMRCLHLGGQRRAANKGPAKIHTLFLASKKPVEIHSKMPISSSNEDQLLMGPDYPGN